MLTLLTLLLQQKLPRPEPTNKNMLFHSNELRSEPDGKHDIYSHPWQRGGMVLEENIWGHCRQLSGQVGGVSSQGRKCILTNFEGHSPRFGAVGSDVGQINKVTLSRALLVLARVTISGFSSRCGKLSQFNQPPMSTQPGHSSVGRHNEYRPKGSDALRSGVKADMVLFAGNTVWSISERVRSVCVDALYKSTFNYTQNVFFNLYIDVLNLSNSASCYIWGQDWGLGSSLPVPQSGCRTAPYGINQSTLRSKTKTLIRCFTSITGILSMKLVYKVSLR